MRTIKFKILDKSGKEFFPTPNSMVIKLDGKVAFSTNKGVYLIPDVTEKDLGQDCFIKNDYSY